MADARTRFSLRLNNDVPVAEFVELARLAESLEFDQIWVSNDLFFRAAPVLLAAAAAATSRIALGTCVLNPYSLHPAEIAMTAVTLQELSGGRFLLGLAAGAEDFLGWAGIDRRRSAAADARGRRRHPGAVLGRLAGRRPGQRRSLAHRGTAPRPAAATPIYLGAMSPRMLESIGEIADGGLPLLYPPESFVDTRRTSTPAAPAPAGSGATSISPRASGSRSIATRDGHGGHWPRSSPTTAPRSRRSVLANVGVDPACWSCCATSIRLRRPPRCRRR